MCTLCQSLSPTSDYQLHRDLATSPGEVVFPVSVTQEATITETTDAAASTATSYSLGDNDVFSGSVDFVGDVDWIEVSLADGAALAVQQDNISLGGTNTFIELYAADGTTLLASESYYDFDESALVYYNDTGSAQTVYIAATSFNGGTGDYQVTALIQEYDTGSAAEIAEFLTNAWFGTEVAYDVAPGGTIRVDITDLDADEAALALDALEAWTLVTGINFAAEDFDVTGNTGITFVNDVNGDPNVFAAFAGPDSITDNVISGSTVTVTSAWVDAYGTGYDEYSFLTYMHEIGHALGLVHGGPYDGSATYSTTPGGDNVFVNDSYLMTIMSYFSLDDVTGVFTDYYLPVTPMIADILAVQDLYGVAGTLRTDDTTYGYGSTVGGQYDDFINLTGPIGWTIIDDGGVDTIDFTTATESMTIDLTPGAVSSVGGGTNNMVIFDTTVIENLVSGDGDDTIMGNSAQNSIFGGDGNDSLDGGAGNDTLNGGLGIDTATYASGSSDISANLGSEIAVAGGLGTDTLISIENFIGGSGNDTVYGSSAENRLEGGDGADLLAGLDGNDILFGGLGADALSGGNDDDELNGELGDDRLFGNAGNDEIYGGDGDDFTNGGSGNDTIYGGNDGDNVLVGGSGNDVVYGGAGSDGINGSFDDDDLYGGIGNDRLYGADGMDSIWGEADDDTMGGNGDDDQMWGGDGNDGMAGGGGDDQLFGGSGDDRIYGGTGADTIAGGTGNDLLVGQSGIDTFVFESDWGQDQIASYGDIGSGQPRVDEVIDMSAIGITFDDLTIVSNGNFGTLIYITADGSTQNSIEILYRDPTEITESDFFFG